jgi:hypothetical protein
VSDSDLRRVSFGAELEKSTALRWSSVGRLASVPHRTLIFVAIRFIFAVAVRLSLFDSVPTRFCLGTWQMPSSPLLVMWKSNPLALGPRLIALFE